MIIKSKHFLHHLHESSPLFFPLPHSVSASTPCNLAVSQPLHSQRDNTQLTLMADSCIFYNHICNNFNENVCRSPSAIFLAVANTLAFSPSILAPFTAGEQMCFKDILNNHSSTPRNVHSLAAEVYFSFDILLKGKINHRSVCSFDYKLPSHFMPLSTTPIN